MLSDSCELQVDIELWFYNIIVLGKLTLSLTDTICYTNHRGLLHVAKDISRTSIQLYGKKAFLPVRSWFGEVGVVSMTQKETIKGGWVVDVLGLNAYTLEDEHSHWKRWLEDYFPVGKVTFQGRTVKLQMSTLLFLDFRVLMVAHDGNPH